jgi:hypothetical protein
MKMNDQLRAAAIRFSELASVEIIEGSLLRRRLKNPPLAAPIDPANFIFGDADIPLLMRAAREAPGEAAAGPDRDEAGGG